MALATLNGQPVISAMVEMPLVGAWTADLRIDSQEEISGAVNLVFDGGLTLLGTTVRTELYLDAVHMLIVGGAGGLTKAANAQHYESVTAGAVLADLMSASGEALDPSSSADVTGAAVEAWTMATISIGRAISRLLASTSPGAGWRVLPSGRIFVGTEAWPDSGLDPDEYAIVSEDPENGTALVGVETVTLVPGVALAGRRITYVEHQVDAGRLRTRVWFDDVEDRLHAALGAVVRGASVPVDYHALYLAQVVTQSGDTVDVQPDDARIPSMPGVKLLTGTPATSVSMAGGRVLVGWSGGDPAHAFALGFDSETVAQAITLAGTTVNVGGDVGAQPTIMGATYRSAEATMNTALASAASGLSAACTGPLAPLAAGFAAMASAWQAFEAGAAGYQSTQAKVI